MEPKVILFLGAHGRGLYNIGGKENAESAIIQIRKRTKKIQNKDKILVVECSGWTINQETQNLILSGDKTRGREIFDEVVTYYKESIRVFKEGGDVEFPGWVTILLKFGVDNGYITVLEEPDFETPWKHFVECRFGEYDKLQTERDERFVNQLIGLMREYPNKTLIVVRGKQHEKWMPGILKRNDISYKIVYYPEQASIFDRWSYKLSKSFNRKIK